MFTTNVLLFFVIFILKKVIILYKKCDFLIIKFLEIAVYNNMTTKHSQCVLIENNFVKTHYVVMLSPDLRDGQASAT